MSTITVIIRKNKDSYFAYTDNLEDVHASGSSIGETLQLITHAINELKLSHQDNMPQILEEDFEIAIEHL